MGVRTVFRLASLSFFLLSGCLSVPGSSLQDSRMRPLAFGSIHVATDGPHPRMFPTMLRFFSLTNEDTGERFRVDVHSDSDVFSLRLAVGNYVVDRVQFNAGPFMAESHVRLNVRVPDGKAVYLGAWEFTVDTPRTIRRVRIRILEGEPEFPKALSADIVSNAMPIETALPEPDTFETRVFQVAPLPKVKYFYRR